MMARSLFLKITLLFAIAFLAIIGAAISYGNYQEQASAKARGERYITLVRALHYLEEDGKGESCDDYLDELGFDFVCDTEEQSDILKDATPLKHISLQDASITILKLYGNHYLHVKRDHLPSLLLIDERCNDAINRHIAIFSLLALITLILYVLVISSLRPLTTLRSKITEFSEGAGEVDFSSPRKDEIGKLFNDFEHAAHKIRALIESRRHFMRTVMHELRTPIAKGRIAAELIDDNRQKERIVRSFERLDELIREYAQYERLASHTYQIDPKPYRPDDLLDHALDLLIRSDEEKARIERHTDDTLWRVDFELFTLALKNLIDNALKHGKKGPIVIEAHLQEFRIKNHGDPLQHDLEAYFDPFIANTEGTGLGFGISIIHHVLNKHTFALHYRYEKGTICFAIRPREIL